MLLTDPLVAVEMLLPDMEVVWDAVVPAVAVKVSVDPVVVLPDSVVIVVTDVVTSLLPRPTTAAAVVGTVGTSPEG